MPTANYGNVHASSLQITHAEHLFSALHLPFFIPEALDSCVDFIFMHIYAFIVLHMQLNAFLTYICTYTHIFAHIYILYYMKIPHFETIVPIICIQEHSMDTRVHFLQSVRLQVTHTPFEFV